MASSAENDTAPTTSIEHGSIKDTSFFPKISVGLDNFSCLVKGYKIADGPEGTG